MVAGDPKPGKVVCAGLGLGVLQFSGSKFESFGMWAFGDVVLAFETCSVLGFMFLLVGFRV